MQTAWIRIRRLTRRLIWIQAVWHLDKVSSTLSYKEALWKLKQTWNLVDNSLFGRLRVNSCRRHWNIWPVERVKGIEREIRNVFWRSVIWSASPYLSLVLCLRLGPLQGHGTSRPPKPSFSCECKSMFGDHQVQVLGQSWFLPCLFLHLYLGKIPYAFSHSIQCKRSCMYIYIFLSYFNT